MFKDIRHLSLSYLRRNQKQLMDDNVSPEKACFKSQINISQINPQNPEEYFSTQRLLKFLAQIRILNWIKHS
jgi:hypothetical protein